MTKIYTKTGDSGTTLSTDGKRVPKDDLLIDFVGQLDELNAHVGLLITLTEEEDLKLFLRSIQTALFDIGGAVCHPEPMIQTLEQAIDRMQAEIPQLHCFVYPGTCTLEAQCHVCRTVCRRAERAYVRLARERDTLPSVLQLLNRLSDYFFVLSRKVSHNAGKEEKTW